MVVGRRRRDHYGDSGEQRGETDREDLDMISRCLTTTA